MDDRMGFAGLAEGLRDGRWLTRPRAIAAGQVLALIQGTILILLALWQHGVTTDQPSANSSDFVSFYAAGKLALAGMPALAYDQAAHFLAEQHFMVPGAPYQFFFYPPVYLLVCAPLALLPYTVAYYAFQAATLAAFLLVMRAILRHAGRGWLAPVLAFPPLFWNIGLGQNAFLSAALFGGFSLLLDRRRAGAGALLGCLCYKPHFGVLAPIALLCGGHWRPIAAAGATVLGLVALSAAVFGVESWHAYLNAFAASGSVYGTGRIDYAGIVTPFGAARLLGAGPATAYAAQALCAVALAIAVGAVWRFSASTSGRVATLAAATLLAVPVALLYDQMLLLVAIGWLLRDQLETGFLPWEKTALASVWLLTLVGYPIGATLDGPVLPLASLVVIVLSIRRAIQAAVAPRGTTARPRPTGPLPAE